MRRERSPFHSVVYRIAPRSVPRVELGSGIALGKIGEGVGCEPVLFGADYNCPSFPSADSAADVVPYCVTTWRYVMSADGTDVAITASRS